MSRAPTVDVQVLPFHHEKHDLAMTDSNQRIRDTFLSLPPFTAVDMQHEITVSLQEAVADALSEVAIDNGSSRSLEH